MTHPAPPSASLEPVPRVTSVSSPVSASSSIPPVPPLDLSALLTLSYPAKKAESLLIIAVATTFVMIAVIWNGWMCDDAFITFRTIDNWFAGYGLRWNPLERVQSYTHPLWMFLVAGAYAIARDFYYAAQALSILLTIGTLALLFGALARSPLHVLLAACFLCFSRAFVDYSTSGLENALSHFLFALFAAAFFRFHTEDSGPLSARRVAILFFLASLAMLNRLDAILLYIPALLFSLFRLETWSKKTGLLLFAATAPFWLWEIFSLVYYGFFFPNTAYAKLATGLSSRELLTQGFYYFLYTLQRDPLTALAVIGALVAGLPLLAFRKRRAEGLIVLGLLLYLAYLLRIGGDFMAGRFFSLPVVVAIVFLLRLRLNLLYHAVPLAAFCFLIAARSPNPTHINTAPWKGHDHTWGIADERTFFFDGTSLMEIAPGRSMPAHTWIDRGLKRRKSGERVVVWGSLGMFGLAAGPKVHILDYLALTDPLLARLPMQRDPSKRWRPGHYTRVLPHLYEKSVLGQNVLLHPRLHLYWDKLRLVTRASLFSLERWKAIWGFHTGAYTADLRAYCETSYFLYKKADLSRLRKTGEIDYGWKSLPMPLEGIGLRLRDIRGLTPRYSVSVSQGQAYRTFYIREHLVIGEERWVAPKGEPHTLFTYEGRVPPALFKKGFDAIKVAPLSLDARPRLGHFLFWHTPHERPLSAFSRPRYPGSPWNAQGNLLLGLHGTLHAATIGLPELSRARKLEYSADGNDDYLLAFLHKGKTIATKSILANPRRHGGIQIYTVETPSIAIRLGFDAIRFLPLQGDGVYSLGHLRLLEETAPPPAPAPRTPNAPSTSRPSTLPGR